MTQIIYHDTSIGFADNWVEGSKEAEQITEERPVIRFLQSVSQGWVRLLVSDTTVKAGFTYPKYDSNASATEKRAVDGLSLSLILALYESSDSEAIALAAQENWQAMDPQVLIMALQMLMQCGRGRLAWEIVRAQASWISWDSPLMSYYGYLSRYSVRRMPSSLTPGEKASQEWLSRNHDAYHGKWVAVKDGQLLKASTCRDDLLPYIKSHAPGVHLARL